MTKRNLLLSLFLVLGLVAAAPSAMATQWTAGANIASYGRVEVHAEATGQVTLGLITGGYVNSGSWFSITYNVPIAELASATIVCTGATVGTNESPFIDGCGSVGSILGAPYIDPTSSNHTLVVPFAATTYFNSGDGSQISVTVRVDAATVALTNGQFIVTANVLAHTPNGGAQVSLGNANPVVGLQVLVINGPSIALSDLTEAMVLTCIGAKEVASYDKSFAVNVAENFIQALTSESVELYLDPDMGEFVNGGYPTGSAEWTTDISNGSDFTITFSNVPTGVGIKMVSIDPCSDPASSNPCQSPVGTLNAALASANPVTGPDSNGQIAFTFAVTSVDNNEPENLDIYFKFWSDGPLPPGLKPSMITAALSYSPNPPGLPPTPYFVSTPEKATPAVVQFYDCVTNLLFPFVTNYLAGGSTAYNNLGTNVFVANTTADPFNTPGAVLASPEEVEGAAVPQSGMCTFWLFPNADSKWDGKAGGVQAWTPQVTIWPGATYGFDMGSVPAFAGLTGYMFAQCGFQNAHAVAYITDDYGVGEPGYAAVYQAIVIPTPEFYHRSPAGDGLGETAVAPIAIDKFVQKLISGGIHNAYSTPWKGGK